MKAPIAHRSIHIFSITYASNAQAWVDPLGLTPKNLGNLTNVSNSQPSKCKANLTVNQARREALRRAGIPVSSTPVLQRTSSGSFSRKVPAPPGMEQYAYKVQTSQGAKLMILSHHKPDDDHPCAHWHVGEAKTLNENGMPTTFNDGAWKYQTGGPVVEHK